MDNFYTFNPEDAESFARRSGTRTQHKSGELFFAECPYCHSKKDKWKFSINLSTGQYQCKRASCGAKGNMLTLARDFGLDLGRDVNVYYNLNNERERYYKIKARINDISTTDKAVEYLKGRGISEEVVERYKITTHKDDDNKIVFPFVDDNGNVVSVKYRFIDTSKSGGNKEIFFTDRIHHKQSRPVLFGMYQCEDNERLVITEGQIDSLSLAEAGIKNAVSVPNGANGFTWVPLCWDWVNKFQEIVIFGDCENGNITLVDGIKQSFRRNNIKVVRVKDYKDCKDANEILQKFGKDALIKAVENAEQITNDRIIRASSVEAVDIEKTPSVSTGIDALDKAMSGGFRGGDLIVLTGKRGDGKSTFASQIIANVLNDEDVKVFMYSGEMVNINVKRWLDMQLVGRSDIQNSIIDRVNAWYHDRLFFYDNTAINEDEDVEVLRIAEHAIDKYGCNFIVIDNLMTALDSGNNDIYRMQSVFAKKCATLARRTNTTIILISHPKKGGGDVFDNDFISGSADITNAANYVLCYQRAKDSQEAERMLTVNKNRLTGKLLTGDEGIPLKYSDTSKRIVDIFTDFDHIRYGWQNDEQHNEVINNGLNQIKFNIEESPF